MSTLPYKSKVILAMESLKIYPNPSHRAAAKNYNIECTILARPQAGQPARYDISPNYRKLTDLEEETTVQYILNLCTLSFPPNYAELKI